MSKKFDFTEWLLEELIEAYFEARRNGKRKTKNEHEFEMNEIENLVTLRDTIMARKYKPGKGIAFVIHDPVMREIFAAPFVDRIVHHFLYKHAIVWWEPRLWRGAYSCRKGKGTLAGIIDLQKNMRRVSHDGAVETVVVKRDLQGFFMSLNRLLKIWRIKFTKLQPLVKETLTDLAHMTDYLLIMIVKKLLGRYMMEWAGII